MTTAAVPALRATWRRSAQHFAEQVKRFLRLTALAALPSIVNLFQGGRFDWRTLLAFVLPFAEVAYREVFPALGAAAADTAPGVAIVPEQVGLPATPDAPAQPATPADPAPASVDLNAIPQDIADAGHADVILVLAITIGVFLGDLIYHLALR